MSKPSMHILLSPKKHMTTSINKKF